MSGRRKLPFSFQEIAQDAKLVPVEQQTTGRGKRRNVAKGPTYACSTYVSITATCPETCVFKDAGCYAQDTIPSAMALDKFVEGRTALEVILAEVALIDDRFVNQVPQDGGQYQPRSKIKKVGRDLRLHISGDASCVEGAKALAGAAKRWANRGGGAVFAYTHRWMEIPRDAWGGINVLASVEDAVDMEEAAARDYAPAIVVREFLGRKRSTAFTLPGSTRRVLPCPQEVPTGTTCIQCRWCLDRNLLERNEAIAFEAHNGVNRIDVTRSHLPIYRPDRDA